MSTTSIATLAQAELNRRASQRKTGKQINHLVVNGRKRPCDSDLRQRGNASLHSLVGDTAPAAPKAARKAPASKPAKVARAQVAQAKAPVERKGADPVKQLRAQVASVLVPEVKPYTGAEWWDAYKATRGMTADELTTSLKALQVPVSA